MNWVEKHQQLDEMIWDSIRLLDEVWTDDDLSYDVISAVREVNKSLERLSRACKKAICEGEESDSVHSS